MRAIALISLVAVAAPFGGGCSYPFTIETEGRLEMPFGVVRRCSGTDSFDYMGSHTDIVYTLEGTRCSLHADWEGPIVDMAELREDARDDLEALGIDPDEMDQIELRVGDIKPEVDEAGLANRRTDVPIEMPAGALAYRGTLSVPGDENVVVVELPEGSRFNDPEVTIRESERLVELAEAAWLERTELWGTGTADVVIDLARILEVPDLPRRPAFAVKFAITLEGDASM
jgi:hypothetical protein